jgi:hydroxycarboxylate dehydrogenase A
MLHQTLMKTAAALAPTTYLCTHGALHHLGAIVSPHGQRALLVHGEIGYDLVRATVDRALVDARIDVTRVGVKGPCTADAIDVVAAAARRHDSRVVVAVGGGRVLDVAKAAAMAAGAACVTVPTSAATCAAVRAHTVLYTSSGTPSGARPLPLPPAACVIDLDVVAAAPPRLLASGLLDALAKWHEIDLLHRRSPLTSVGGRSAHALARSIAEAVDEDGARAIAEVRAGAPGDAADRAVEVAILLPGLVSGLAGGNNAMAVAHAVHDALTYLPGAHASLHGELVGFGLIVQALLAEEQATAAHLRGVMIGLGAPRTLADLGCGDALEDAGMVVAGRLAAAPAVRRAFGELATDRVAAALVEADALLS